jgi:hypothetical protein
MPDQKGFTVFGQAAIWNIEPGALLEIDAFRSGFRALIDEVQSE